eukprot:405929-Prorocentrum_minimum.AAC.1
MRSQEAIPYNKDSIYVLGTRKGSPKRGAGLELWTCGVNLNRKIILIHIPVGSLSLPIKIYPPATYNHFNLFLGIQSQARGLLRRPTLVL